MTVSADYNTALTTLETLQGDISDAIDAMEATKADTPLEYTTLSKALDNVGAAVRHLRGPENGTAGSSDRTKTKLTELNL
jgi:hypothetical protein